MSSKKVQEEERNWADILNHAHIKNAFTCNIVLLHQSRGWGDVWHVRYPAVQSMTFEMTFLKYHMMAQIKASSSS